MSDSFKIDFVGIGASKAGTTWLGHMLDAHPQICISEPREVEFFNDILQFREKASPNYGKGLNWYRRFFSHCKTGQLKGEMTPRYGMDPIAASRIKEHNPDIKIFLCMRSPVDRIWSHYRFASFFGKNEDRPLEVALRDEPMYFRMSSYYQTIDLYQKYFPKEQMFLIWFEDIVHRPAHLLKEIYTFLGVDPEFQP
ncbi:MAG: sulfotransferase domain-containing protein, partial [Saprospiraceae bacterium]